MPTTVIETETDVIIVTESEATSTIEVLTSGPAGATGADGADGTDGLSPAHETDGSGQIRFQNPDGSWGDWITIIVDGGSF